MKHSLLAAMLIGLTAMATACTAQQNDNVETINVPTSTVNVPATPPAPKMEDVLERDRTLRISVVGQGVAPTNTSSPAQAYALAKRAATADAYRMIAEKIKGVRVEGQDLIQNMMIKRSSVRTSVSAMVRDAHVVETTFREGLCEVEMEIVLSHSQFRY